MKTRTKMMGVIFAAAAFVFSAAASAKDLRLGLIVPGTHAWSVAATAMGNDLRERSDGKYSITIFPPASLAARRGCCSNYKPGHWTWPS